MLSKKNKEILLGPLSKNNPVIVQILGICSALAVTAKNIRIQDVLRDWLKRIKIPGRVRVEVDIDPYSFY